MRTIGKTFVKIARITAIIRTIVRSRFKGKVIGEREKVKGRRKGEASQSFFKKLLFLKV